MKTAEGFLIVLRSPDVSQRLNSKYRGVDRLPSYRFADQAPIQTESEALERYILGDIRSESGLIDSYETALELNAQLANSPRKFEIIWCRVVPESAKDTTPSGPGRFIGYDVAALRTDYWSIVGDFTNDARFVHQFRELNDDRLFASAENAAIYLAKYRELGLSDSDSPFQIVQVNLV